MCIYIYIYILYIHIYNIYIHTCVYICFMCLFVVTHRVFHTRLPGVCSDGRPESPSESLNRSDA